ncbi:hypothetical protein HDA39_008360 [Kribbella italica]|uniref:Uncharacterized protein n=1 Tax=Kribbella italica TaxID=1540520 RepID=A0A7W9JGB9_9ACTN|nr:hypothetical protein [Kribbella italica]
MTVRATLSGNNFLQDAPGRVPTLSRADWCPQQPPAHIESMANMPSRATTMTVIASFAVSPLVAMP